MKKIIYEKDFQEWLESNVPCWYLNTVAQDERHFEDFLEWKREHKK